jgi:hypothetical protein
VLAGNDLGNVVGQRQSYGFLYGYDFKHSRSFASGFRPC